jgi:hypothetical protein
MNYGWGGWGEHGWLFGTLCRKAASPFISSLFAAARQWGHGVSDNRSCKPARSPKRGSRNGSSLVAWHLPMRPLGTVSGTIRSNTVEQATHVAARRIPEPSR